MARPSQQALSDVAQALRQAGATTEFDQDSLEELLLTVRARVRSADHHGSPEVQRQGALKALRPIWSFVNGQPELQGVAVDVKSDLCWNIFAASLARTATADAFPEVTGDLAVWQQLIETLARGVVPQSSVQRTGTWSNNRAVQCAMLGLGCLAAEGWITSGRGRFYLSAVGFGFLALAGLVWYLGYDSANQTPGPRELVQENQSLIESSDGYSIQPSAVAPNLEPSVMPQTLQPQQAPPPLAPPLPTIAEPVQTPQGALAVGTLVEMLPVAPYTVLSGQRGVIIKADGEKCDVRLESGLELSSVAIQGVKVCNAETIPSQSVSQFYAPMAGSTDTTKAQLQAGRLKEALTRASAMQTTMPAWASLFWQSVKNESDLYGLDESVKKLLECHGYFGHGTTGPPRTDELKKGLQEIETLGVPAHGISLQSSGTLGQVGDPEHLQWHLRLPADLQRAAPELYRNIRAEGVASVRQWVNEQHPTLEQKQSPTYQDLFTTATIIDYELADCRSESSIMHKLATSDMLEIQLRKLGSFVYLRRTKDRAGAQRMLGVRAPGANADIAPKWMLDDANAFSKVEFQRVDRGNKQHRQDGGGTSTSGGGTKYAGKFRGRGRGSGDGKGGGKKSGGGGGGKTTQG